MTEGPGGSARWWLLAAAGVLLLYVQVPRAWADSGQVVAPDTVVSIADAGTTLAVPMDGRLRGYEFSGRVLGVATGPRLGSGSGAQVAGPGQRLWVFGLEWTTQTDDLSQPQTVSPTLVVDGTRIAIPLPAGFAQAAPPDSSWDTGPMYWVASVPANAADVAVELASAGYPQTFSLSGMARQGPQPPALYRDPATWMLSQPLSEEKSVSTPDPSGTDTGAALPIQLQGATLSWFGPDSPTHLPANTGLAWLVPQLATDTTNLGMCYPSLPAADVTLTLPGGHRLTSTRFPGLGPDQQTNAGQQQGAFTAAYGFQVPAGLTTASLTVSPGSFQAQVGNCATPVDVTATGSATFTVDLPASAAYTPPAGAATIPAAIHNLASTAGPTGSAKSGGSDTAPFAAAAAIAALLGAAALLIGRRRRLGARRLAPASTDNADIGTLDTPAASRTDPAAPSPTPNASPPSGEPIPVLLIPPDAPPDPPDEAPEVQVVGEPRVVDWPAGTPPPGPSIAELLAFLALHPGRPLSTVHLRSKLGVGRQKDLDRDTIRRYMGELRAALGPDHVPPGRAHAGYEIKGITTDADRLTDYIQQAARNAEPVEKARALANALALVRGAPFSNVTEGTYGWAFDESLLASDLSNTILRAATDLAELALIHQDAVLATWAAERGLAVWPTEESLHRLALTASALARPSRVIQAWASTKALLKLHGEVPSADLEDHYRRLRDQT